MTVAEIQAELERNPYYAPTRCECGGRIWKESVNTFDGFFIRWAHVCDLCEREVEIY